MAYRGSTTAVPAAVANDYDIGVAERLNFETVSPLFQRYSVNLTGEIDGHWVECYQRKTADTPLARFQLDALSGSISFTCRASDAPADVMGVLKKLEELIGTVNDEAAQPARPSAAVRSRTTTGTTTG